MTTDPDAMPCRVALMLHAGDRAMLRRLHVKRRWTAFDRAVVLTILFEVLFAALAADKAREGAA